MFNSDTLFENILIFNLQSYSNAKSLRCTSLLNKDFLHNLFQNTSVIGKNARKFQIPNNRQRELFGEIFSQSHKRVAFFDSCSEALLSTFKRWVTGSYLISTNMDNLAAQLEISQASQDNICQQLLAKTDKQSKLLLTSQAIQMLEKDYKGK